MGAEGSITLSFNKLSLTGLPDLGITRPFAFPLLPLPTRLPVPLPLDELASGCAED